MLGPGSVWQNAPSWLVQDQSTCPVTETTGEVINNEDLKKFAVKSKSKLLKLSFPNLRKLRMLSIMTGMTSCWPGAAPLTS